VSKNAKEFISEFMILGVFQIDVHNFFMTCDRKWSLNNTSSTCLNQVKLSYYLLPVQYDPNFAFLSNDFPVIIL
jgi:hypothetical protein